MSSKIPKSISLSELKLQLTQLGISTSTPDLEGEPRYLELLSRLQKYYDSESETSKIRQISRIDTSSTSRAADINVSTANIDTSSHNDDLQLESLSIIDIKSKLALYGESASTPGIVGEDRRKTLIQRLRDIINMTNNYTAMMKNDATTAAASSSIISSNTSTDGQESNVTLNENGTSGNESNNNDSNDGISDSTVHKNSSELTDGNINNTNMINVSSISASEEVLKIRSPRTKPTTIPTSSASSVAIAVPSSSSSSSSHLEKLKRKLKAMQNQRATAIASRIATTSVTQDLYLKKDEKMQRKIESELVRVRSIQSKNPVQLVSSILVVNNNSTNSSSDGVTAAAGSGSKGFGKKKSDTNANTTDNVATTGGGLSVTSAVLIRELEQLKYEYAEKIKVRKAEIREEEESDVHYGTMTEQQLLTHILDLSYETNKDHRASSKIFTSSASTNDNNNNKRKDNLKIDTVDEVGSSNNNNESDDMIYASFQKCAYSDDVPRTTTTNKAGLGSSQVYKNVKAYSRPNSSSSSSSSVANNSNNSNNSRVKKSKLTKYKLHDDKSTSKEVDADNNTDNNNNADKRENNKNSNGNNILSIADSNGDEEDDVEDDDVDDDDYILNKSAIFRREAKSNNEKKISSTLQNNSNHTSISGGGNNASTFNDNIKLAYNKILDDDDDDDVEDEDDDDITSLKNHNYYSPQSATVAAAVVNNSSSYDDNKEDSLLSLVQGILSVSDSIGNSAGTTKSGGTTVANTTLENKTQNFLNNDSNNDRDDEDISDNDNNNDDNQSDNDDDDDDDDDNDNNLKTSNKNIKLKILYKRVKTLINLNDLNTAEKTLHKALEVNPLNIRTLNMFAVFLHTKRGELSRAEAFFQRALYVCIPGFIETCRQQQQSQPHQNTSDNTEKAVNGSSASEQVNSSSNNTNADSGVVSSMLLTTGSSTGSNNSGSGTKKKQQLYSVDDTALHLSTGTTTSSSLLVGNKENVQSAVTVSTTDGTAIATIDNDAAITNQAQLQQYQSLPQPLTHSQGQPPHHTNFSHNNEGTKLQDVVNVLINFARFLTRAKGDVELAGLVYRKALEIHPDDALVVSSLAHFLAFDCGGATAGQEAALLFARAMRLNPHNTAQTALWYAKLLKKMNKLGPAELMYLVAVEKSSKHGFTHLEPTALCNYATFLYKYRNNNEKALIFYSKAIKKYPTHKGLVKNFNCYLRLNPHVGVIADFLP